MRRAIVIFPPEADLREAALLRQRFDPLAHLVAPHLTLVFPFDDDLPRADLERHMRTVLTGRHRFDLRLSGVTASDGEYLFLNVKRGNDEIIALHDALYGGRLEPHLSRMHTFVPHMTIGRLSTGVEDALRSTSAPMSIDTCADAVTAYRIHDDGRREIELVIALE